MVTVAQKRAVVAELQEFHQLSERTSCELVDLHRSVARYAPLRIDPPDLIERILAIAAERPRFGYRRIHRMLLREGFKINRKRVLRIYQELHLQVRRKRRKQAARASRLPKLTPTLVNEGWSMDFMSDTLVDGRSLRIFNVVDDCSREAVTMEVGNSIPAAVVIRALERAIEERGCPAWLTCDNGPEFTSNALDAWAYGRGIELRFIRPGKPQENAYVESFNARVRDELLNQHCFRNLEEARTLVENWQQDYNHVRPHGSLKDATPSEFAARLQEEGYPSSCTGQAKACFKPLDPTPVG